MQTAKDLPGISCGLVNDNVFEWEVMLMISDDCKYYGGMSPHPPSLPPHLNLPPFIPTANFALPTGGNFRCLLTFPPTYPLLPPSLTFKSPIPFHPNIYPSGLLCISILHPPQDDEYGYESAAERWSPVQTPETILLSVISLLHSPNDESPANVEAARLWREEKVGGKDAKEFKRRCRRGVRESLGED
jgi:ubiquitin-conjugating enzyme E2 G1